MKVLLTLLTLAVLALAGVQAKYHAPVGPSQMNKNLGGSGRWSHADIHNATLWAPYRKALEARNYQRPQSQSPDGGVQGIDISNFMDESTWGCMNGQGYTFGIVRAWQSNCVVDPNGVHSVANAWASGIAHVDIYLFPAFGCSTAASQVDQTIANMGSIPFGTLWLDIEASGSGWGGVDANHAWLVEAVNEASSQLGASRVGIYSSSYGWSVAMGGYSDLSNLALWYAHCNEGFGDFSSFGGWSSPSMKQFAGDASLCSADVDLNWYPA